MLLKIKRVDICNIYLSLRSLNEKEYNKIFLFYVHRNLNLLELEFNDTFALEQTTHPCGEFLEFTELRTSLLEQYVMRDSSGNLYVDNNDNYVFKPEDAILFNDELNNLKMKFATSIKENDSNINDVNAILDQLITIDVEPIPFRYVPSELLDNQWKYLKHLILESDEKILSSIK